MENGSLFNLPVMTTFEMNFLLLFIFLVLTTAGILFYERYKRKQVVEKTAANHVLTERDFEKFSPPLVAQLIFGRGAYTRHITAGLLNLVRKKILVLQQDKEGHYYFTVKGAAETPKAEDEKFLYGWMLYEIGKDGVFHIDDLYNFTEERENREIFLHKLYEWEEKMKNELVGQGLFAVFSPFKRVLAGISLVMVLLGSGFIIASPFLSILYLAAGLATFIIMLCYSSMTHAGRYEYQKWKPFIYDIRKSSAEKFEESGKISASYVYAIAFDLKDTYVKKFPVREASQLSLRTDQFPLYFAAAPGTTALSLEGIQLIDELESSLEQIISPIAYSPDETDDSGGALTE
ncbi:DUF2207 domain-containing protein [Salipaludibacillus sp. CUR1]|uniref:DUF2207 family protein n=1 Tax=Salipaludibacillus sp. CUR1 TaxID=2820003 RepID=UPI001E601F94|nr:DUF2207 domain-containing protein [Salipaludibacillus sp. CUR1]MCE7791203.1 DUF2207 domain-containing protein [Salipaludibacillus sp. CUR1]